MSCTACGHENRAGRKFCVQCGAKLSLACASCSAPYEAGEKFCGECGAALGEPAPRPSAPAVARPADAGARKVVTIVFADLVGSTALHERLDAESARRVMERYYEALGSAVGAHGGTVVKLLGDGVMAAFGLRQVTEDDALRAVRAGAAMQDAFRALAREETAALGEVGLRVAVNTGEVVVGGAQDDVIGDPVNVAARLQEQAGNGDVVLGEATRRLVATRVTLAPLGSVALKGRAEAVAAYRLVSLDPPTGAAAAPFVGREDELGRLGSAYDAAVATPATQLAVLLGSPGLGKSRLIDEFAHRHAEAATVFRAHCDAAGGTTFAPLAQAVRAFLDLDDAATGEAARTAIAAALSTVTDAGERSRIAAGVAALIGGAPTSPEETFFVVRRFLAGIAAASPVVLVIDDLHWAEPLLLDLVEHLVQWGGGVPLFVLVGARPELHDLRSSLVTPGGLVADVVTLGGLDAGAAMRLAANVIGAADLPAAVAAKVLATSEGNPLFVGELVRMLVQEGALTKEGERWTIGAGLASLEMPPTIHALLAARIERLRPEERSVLERAAVVGRHFSRSAVAALLPRDGDLDARLEALRRSELIERDTGWLLGEPVLRFHHVLIRDAAYRRLLKGTRAELHARLADWMEAQVGAAPEHDETIGWHLEQAHRHLRELGPIDATGAALGERAARRLAAAGRRALVRDDVPLAAGLLGRALDRLTPDAPERADLVLDWCEALLSAGDVGPAAAAIEELGRLASDSGRLRAWHVCFAGQLTVLTAPEALQATADRVGAAARDLAAQGDAAGEAKAHFVHAQALARLGKVGACEAALDQALAAARRAGDRRRANAVLAGAPIAALWGPSPVTRASGRCLDVVRVLRITQGAPAVEAVALSCQGVLEALRGRTDAARRMIAASRKMVEELGITHRLLETDVFAGRIDLLEHDAAAAEEQLRGAYDGLRELGLGIDAARAAALLGRALLALDRAAEAETLSHESELLAGDDLQAAIAWRGVRAEALARRGEHAAAVELAKAGVAIASATDALLDHADARLALAAALRAAGRGGEADAETRRATELWDAKGATLLAERVRSENRQAESSPHPAANRAEPARGEPHRVRANAATVAAAEFDAAFASGDVAAIEAAFVHVPDVRVVDHPTETTYGREGAIDSFRRLLRSKDSVVRHESLATLGDSLGLFRRHISSGGTTGGRYDVADYQREEYVVVEPGVMIEIFAADRLDDAVECLYGRHAELLPDGAERRRATLTARSVTGWSATNLELAPDFAFRWEEVIALAPHALLVRGTYLGSDRAGGGRFENRVCTLTVFGADGLVTSCDVYEAESTTEALARFDEIVRDAAIVVPTASNRMRPNDASGLVTMFQEAFEAGDAAALAELFSPELEVVDHPNGATYGLDGHLTSVRRLRRARDPVLRFEPIATLGERLLLARRHIAGSGAGSERFDVGEYERDVIVLFGVAAGRFCHIDVFAADHLNDAVVRLYERHAAMLPEGPGRDRTATAARSLEKMMFGFVDPERLANPFSPAVEWVDHRVAGVGVLRGDVAVLAAVRAFLDLARNVSWRFDELLACSPDAILTRSTNLGVDRRSGGTFERTILSLVAFGADGSIARWESFEATSETEALARYDALVGSGDEGLAGAPGVSLCTNAATRFNERLARAWAVRDWDAVTSLHTPALQLDDRRRLLQMRTPADTSMAQLRVLFDVPGSRWVVTPIATRGERLALSRVLFEGVVEGGGGDLAIDTLSVDEVDADGGSIAVVLFDLDDLDAAFAELDRRYYTGGCAPPAAHALVMRAFTGAVASRDWEEVVALCSPTFVEYDHRALAVLGTTRGAEAWAENFRVLTDLAPDTLYRVDHFRSAARGFCSIGTWNGTRDGGRYEIPLIAVIEMDDRDRMARADIYDLDQIDQARARFDEITASAVFAEPARPSAPSERFANAATATLAPVLTAIAAHDWQGLERLFTEDFRCSDRRRMVQLELDWDRYLAFLREVSDGRTVRAGSRAIATRGDRLALARSTFELSDADVGPSEIAFLILTEVDDRGRIVAYVRWDADDLDAAYAELDARWAAGEATAHPLASRWLADYLRFFAARDWPAMTALLAPDLLGENHRLVGWGTRHGPEGIVSTLRAQIELAPDTQERVDHVRTGERAILFEYTWHGTREGGAFENVWVVLVELDAGGRGCRADVWEVEQFAEARARFDALCTSGRPDPLARLMKPNAAAAAMKRWQTLVGTEDWDGMRTIFAPGMIFEDRQGFARLSGGSEMQIASLRERLASGFRAQRRVVGTAGERVVIQRLLWSGGPSDGRFEIENLGLIEVDEAGLVTSSIIFGPDDARAAQREAFARWTAIDPAAGAVLAPLSEATEAYNTRDRDRWQAQLAVEGFVVEDHRRTGFGRLEGADAYTDSIVALWNLAPDATAEVGWHWPAFDTHGLLTVLRRKGTLPNGGGDFESECLFLALVARGRITRVEMFELEDLEAALARFEALRPDPLRIPPNAATRWNDRWCALGEARDRDALVALYAPGALFDDRRRLLRTTGDRETALVNAWHIWEPEGIRMDRALLATGGDRLALERWRMRGGGPGADFEIELLGLTEVDADGLAVAWICFDLDDHAAAFTELEERHLRRTRPATVRKLAERRAAWRDLARLRASLADDFFFRDHRRTGLGHLEGADAYVASVAALFELSPDVTTGRSLYFLADEPHGTLSIARSFGTLAQGGDFESVYAMIMLYGPDDLAGAELFELEDLDAARTRFEALRPVPSRATR